MQERGQRSYPIIGSTNDDQLSAVKLKHCSRKRRPCMFETPDSYIPEHQTLQNAPHFLKHPFRTLNPTLHMSCMYFCEKKFEDKEQVASGCGKENPGQLERKIWTW